jgi:hypothetical protein
MEDVGPCMTEESQNQRRSSTSPTTTDVAKDGLVCTDALRGRSRLASIFGHPLTAVVVGFLLTGLVGWSLSTSYADKQRMADQKREEYEKSVIAIQDLSRNTFRRYARANMLLSSFNRRAPLEEIRTRKRDYDEAVVEWITNLNANLLLTRKMFGDEPYKRLETTIGSKLLPQFNAIDECLTNAYDGELKGRDGDAERVAISDLERCQVEKKLDVVNDVGYQITDDLLALALQHFHAEGSSR